MRRRIIVTGGAGFIGSNFLNYWSKLYPDDLLFVVDNLTYAGNLSNIKNLIEESKINFIKADIANNKNLENIFHEHSINHIVNFAAESHVDRSILNPACFIKTNIEGTFNLLNIFANYWLKNNSPNDWRFLHISTDEVFGSLSINEKKFDEYSPYKPRSPYSASKAASDHLVMAWFHTYNLPVIVSNCSNNFGPYQFPEKLIPLTILKLIKGEKVPIYGDGENIRDWLYVGDHVNALLQVAEKGKVSETYCIGGHGEMTNKNIVNEICKIMDKIYIDKAPHSKLIYFVEDRPGHDRRYAIDPKKLKNELGWKVEKTFSKNLELTVRWYLENIDWCKKVLKNQSLNRRGLNK